MRFSAPRAGCVVLASFLAVLPGEALKRSYALQGASGAAIAAHRTLEEQIGTAEKGIVRERIWEDQGFVEDPAGKVMSGVKIDVFRSGTGRKDALASTKSDFVVHLTNGSYTAVMQAEGCRPLIYISRFSTRECRRTCGST